MAERVNPAGFPSGTQGKPLSLDGGGTPLTQQCRSLADPLTVRPHRAPVTTGPVQGPDLGFI